MKVKLKLSILAIYTMTILTNYDSGCVCFIHMSRQLQKQKLEQRGETFGQDNIKTVIYLFIFVPVIGIEQKPFMKILYF